MEETQLQGETSLGMMKELVCFLYDLRKGEDSPEIPLRIPFDKPENKDSPEYIPFVWHPLIGDLLQAKEEYELAKREREEFAAGVRESRPHEEIEALYATYYQLLDQLLDQLNRLSVPAQQTLKKAGLDMKQVLHLYHVHVNILLPLPESPEERQCLLDAMSRRYWRYQGKRSMKDIETKVLRAYWRHQGWKAKQVPPAPIERLKPGPGRPPEPEKQVLLDRLVQHLRLYIGRIPTQGNVEKLCQILFGPQCNFSENDAIKRAYKESSKDKGPWASDVWAWFRDPKSREWLEEQQLDPDTVRENLDTVPADKRQAIARQIYADLYDRPERKGRKDRAGESSPETLQQQIYETIFPPLEQRKP